MALRLDNMENLKLLYDFFAAISNDARINTTHIGIYASLLEYRRTCNYANPVEVFSYQIMNVAKISAANTYYRCVRDLSRYGYIKYLPSFNSNKPSKIFFPE